MKIIHQSLFQQIKHDSLLRYFEIAWANTDRMTEADYKTEMTTQIELAVQHKIYGYVVDSSQFYFAISPKIQEWTANLLPKLVSASTRKVAFLVTPDIFAQVSKQNTAEKEAPDLLQSRYFEDIEKAKEWLTRDVKIF